MEQQLAIEELWTARTQRQCQGTLNAALLALHAPACDGTRSRGEISKGS
jgi:hypothetical protein